MGLTTSQKPMPFYEAIYKFEILDAEMRIVIQAPDAVSAVKQGLAILAEYGMDIADKCYSSIAVPFPTNEEAIAQGDTF